MDAGEEVRERLQGEAGGGQEDSGQGGKKQKGFFQIKPGSPAYEESSSSALLSLFVYSGLMFTVPLLVYFGAKEVLTEHFGVEPPASFLVPALLSVISVNVVIVMYACKAFGEAKKERDSVVVQQKKDE